MNHLHLSSTTYPGGSPWQGLAPGEHVVLIYSNHETLLTSLERFVAEGLLQGEGVVVLATAPQRIALQARLLTRGFDLESAQARSQYIVLDAQVTQRQHLDPWPDAHRFEQFLQPLLAQVRADGRRVRIFGELVNVLWGMGRSGATLRLEQIWHGLCKKEGVLLLCAYPQGDFATGLEKPLQEICRLHSQVIYM